MHRHNNTKTEVWRGSNAVARVVCVAAALTVVSALTLSAIQIFRSVPPAVTPTRAVFDPSRFILNALLVPVLDVDAVPLQWVNPQPALHCGPDTAVRVNRELLVAGSLVPDEPFELEWQSDGCRPFGAQGPRFDGQIRLTVFREDWGFSAIVEPLGLHIVSTGNEMMHIRRGSASLPRFVETEGLFELN